MIIDLSYSDLDYHDLEGMKEVITSTTDVLINRIKALETELEATRRELAEAKQPQLTA